MTYDLFLSHNQESDGQLARRVQSGLEKLAKPWRTRQALSVFVDTSALGATTTLWDSLQEALDGAEWLVVLLCPAASRAGGGVSREVEYWLQAKPNAASRILLVLTDGNLSWDETTGDFEGSSVPAPLIGIFDSEPRWLDLRWVHDESYDIESLDLSLLRFREVVADLAAPIHGMDRAELDSLAAREETKARRRRVGVAAGLLALALATGIGAWQAAEQRTSAAEQGERVAASNIVAMARLELTSDPVVAAALAMESFSVAGAEIRGQHEVLSEAVARLKGTTWARTVPLTSESGGYRSVAQSEDQNVIAAAGDDGTLTIWDSARFGEATTVHAHDDTINMLALDTAGLLVATAADDGLVKTWILPSGEPFETYQTDGEPVLSVDFSPGGQLIAAGDAAGTVHIINVVEPESTASFPSNLGALWGLDFSPDGSRLAMAGSLGLQIWPLTDSGGEKTKITDDSTLAVSHRGDGAVVASGHEDGSVSIWDTTSGVEAISFSAQAGPIWSVDFSPDSQLLASGGDNGLRIWDLVQQREIASLDDRGGRIWGIAFGPESDLLASTSDEAVTLWSAQIGGGVILYGHVGSLTGLSVDTTSGRLVTADAAGDVISWGADGFDFERTIESDPGTTSSVAHCDEPQFLATGADDGTIDVQTATEQLSLVGHDAPVLDLDLDCERRLVASAGEDGEVRLWRLDTGELLAVLEDRSSPASAVRFADESGALVTAGYDGVVRSWDPVGAEMLGEFDAGVEIFDVDVSSDGSLVAAVGGDGGLLVLDGDLASEPTLVVANAHSSLPWSVALSPLDRMVATGGADGLVRMWRLDTGEELATFSEHTGQVTEVAFGADGTQLISGGGDYIVRLRQVLPSAELCELIGPRVSAKQLAERLEREPVACPNYAP